MHSRKSIVYLASDASSSRLKLYVLQEDVTSSATKKARAVCFDNDPFNPLTFTEDTEKEINAKDIIMWRRDKGSSQQPEDRND